MLVIKYNNNNRSRDPCKWTMDTEGQTVRSGSSNYGDQHKTLYIDIQYYVNEWRESSQGLGKVGR